MASVFPVADVSRSIAFYRDHLGFEVNFIFGDPADYVSLKRDAVSIHLSDKATMGARLSNRSALYIMVDDADAVYEEISLRGATIVEALEDRPYKMRDFACVDPDGNTIAFGTQRMPVT